MGRRALDSGTPRGKDGGVFSERTAWPRAPSPLAQVIEAARARAGAALVDLTASNPTTVALPYDGPRILGALAGQESLRYEPAPFGLPEARQAIAAYYARRGIEVQAERIIVCATTSEAYTFLFRLLANAGESVAVPRPSYPLFSYLGDLTDVLLAPWHLRYGEREGWRLDPTSLEEAIDPTTRAIINVSPNNPTGSVLSPGERRWLAQLAGKAELAVISDEVFLDYLFERDRAAEVTFANVREALSFTLSGLSKVAGLPQLKLSWIVVDGPEGLVAEALARLEIICDSFLSASTPVQRALPELLAAAEPWQDALRARIAQNQATLAELTRGSAVSIRRTEGGWYALADAPAALDDEAWALLLAEEDGVLVHPGYLFDLEEPSCLVLSTIVAPTTFREGVERLVARAALVDRRP